MEENLTQLRKQTQEADAAHPVPDNGNEEGANNTGDLAEEKDALEEITEDLNVQLPHTNLPLLVRIIILLMLVGGLSIVGGSVADLFNPVDVSVRRYLARVGTGIALITISVGMVKRKRLAVWAYAALVALGMGVNPIVAIVPAGIVVVLYRYRRYFEPTFLDLWIESLRSSIEGALHERKRAKEE